MTSRPIRSTCFQPDNYRDLSLFADRESLRDDLVETLASFLSPDGRGEARILIRGDRGVGKSILTRAAINGVVDDYGPLHADVDGARTDHGPEAFLRELARKLGREAVENATNPSLRTSAEMLLRLAEGSKVAVRDVQEWSRALNLEMSVGCKFADTVGFHFGLQRASRRSRHVEVTYEHPVDTTFLQELIQSFVVDCHAAKQWVLLFLDNLDQVGYAENREDVGKVSDLARAVLGLEGCVVIANIRSEFVSSDLRKLYSLERSVAGLGSEELRAIAERRMERAPVARRPAIEEAGFKVIAERLATLTDNAWAFLSWLAFFDFEAVDSERAGDLDYLCGSLERFAEQRFTGVELDDLRKLAACWDGPTGEFRTSGELQGRGVSQERIERAVRYGALVSNWLLSPDRYQLSPCLSFMIGRR